jgi:hypothetical protein
VYSNLGASRRPLRRAVNGAKHRVFDFALPQDVSRSTKPHIEMGGSGIVYAAFIADASARGGLTFR